MILMKKLSFLLILLLQLPLFAQDEYLAELEQNVNLQILLDQAGFSPGEIDGKIGNNTYRALLIFQTAYGLPRTGEADDRTLDLLSASGRPTLTTYRLTGHDVNGPFTPVPSDFMQKAKLPALRYTSVLEAISEKFHLSPDLFLTLNPETELVEGESVTVPNVFNRVATSKSLSAVKPVSGKINNEQTRLKVIISAANSDLMVTRNGKVVFYAPISHGGDRDPVPVGKTKISGVIPNPLYRYNPDLFWDADPSHTKALIRPGPNNPVGLVWIALNLPHYGLHGSPEPSRIGYGTSHGCIRLTNWDALRLAAIVQPETEVVFQ
jgi:lipoprotein-anchoring transpeptidase ErfK/SrfK